jgi:iron complex outermembrane receptor protein
MTHRTTRALLFGFSSLVTLACLAAPAQAQTAPQDDSTTVDEIVVTGTRAVGRTRLDTIAPVDVISAEVLQRQGTGTELATALAANAPSINFGRRFPTARTTSARRPCVALRLTRPWC